jgi:hypothetical protein
MRLIPKASVILDLLITDRSWTPLYKFFPGTVELAVCAERDEGVASTKMGVVQSV